MTYNQICDEVLIQKRILANEYPFRRFVVYVGKNEWETLENAHKLAQSFEVNLPKTIHGLRIVKVEEESHLGIGLGISI